jgi:hypothetical protein
VSVKCGGWNITPKKYIYKTTYYFNTFSSETFCQNAVKFDYSFLKPISRTTTTNNPLILIVVLPWMLTITQLLLQQNAHFYY